MFNRKYIFNPGPFSIAMLDYRSVLYTVVLMAARCLFVEAQHGTTLKPYHHQPPVLWQNVTNGCEHGNLIQATLMMRISHRKNGDVQVIPRFYKVLAPSQVVVWDF